MDVLFPKNNNLGGASQIRWGPGEKRQCKVGPVKSEMHIYPHTWPQPLHHNNLNLEIKRLVLLAWLVGLKCSMFRNVLLHGPNTNEKDMLLIQDRT